MELTPSFTALLQQFAPVFTTPTFLTFVQILTGWILSQRHRYITEVIFSGGNVGNGHWSRFHRFFSHASWNIDALSMLLAKLVVTILAPNAAKPQPRRMSKTSVLPPEWVWNRPQPGGERREDAVALRRQVYHPDRQCAFLL